VIDEELPPATLCAITFDEELDGLPDPNGSAAMVGEVLADDWTPDGDR